MKKHFLFISLLLPAVFVCGQANINPVITNSAKGILVKPVTMDFNLSRNKTESKPLYIINNLSEKKQFVLYLNDWIRDSAGKHAYYDPNTLGRSCASWVKLDKEFVELEPGETVQVNIKMQVPDNEEAVNQMRWTMLFVETTQEKKMPNADGLMTTVNARMRIGVHLYETPPELKNKDVKMLSFDPLVNNDTTIYRIGCQNTGEIQLVCKSYIELFSQSNGKKTQLTPVEFPMFPGQKRYISFMLPPELPKGKYTIVGAVDGGNDLPLEAAQSVIEIK